jgi:hypothetical protein
MKHVLSRKAKAQSEKAKVKAKQHSVFIHPFWLTVWQRLASFR